MPQQAVPAAAPERKPPLPGLTGVRTFLALGIMLFHFTPPHATYIRPVIEAGFTYISFFLLISGYDINCQYRIKYNKRMEDIRTKFGALDSVPKEPLPPTIAAVGKFHLPAHIPSCRFKFSYNFLPGVGMTDGEANERTWPAMNSLASRTKEMGPGHRHDVINDAYGDWNVRRVHNTRESLASTLNSLCDGSHSAGPVHKVPERSQAAPDC